MKTGRFVMFYSNVGSIWSILTTGVLVCLHCHYRKVVSVFAHVVVVICRDFRASGLPNSSHSRLSSQRIGSTFVSTLHVTEFVISKSTAIN